MKNHSNPMKIYFHVLTLTVITMMLPVKVMSQSVNDQIQQIKGRFASINQNKNYEVVTINHEDFLENMTDGGGELQGYFKDGELYKVFESIGLSYCMQTREYYFWDGKLIFVFETEADFGMDSTGAWDYSQTKIAFEGRFYFSNDKLISTNIKGKKLMEDNTAPDSQTKNNNYWV